MVEEGVQQFPELIQGTASDSEKEATFADYFRKLETVQVIEQAFAVDLMTQAGKCYGVVAFIDNTLHCIFAKATILASGGLGHIYRCTSNLTDCNRRWFRSGMASRL